MDKFIPASPKQNNPLQETLKQPQNALLSLKKEVGVSVPQENKMTEWIKKVFKTEKAQKTASAVASVIGFMSTIYLMAKEGSKESVKKAFDDGTIKDADARICIEDEKSTSLSEEFESIRKDSSLDSGQKAIKVAEIIEKNGLKNKHCWDFVAKVYAEAGLKRKETFSCVAKYEGADCAQNCAPESELDNLKPGDHIFINNRNKADQHGNHSVLFLGWKNKDKREANVMGYYAKLDKYSTYPVVIKGPSSAEEWAKIPDSEKNHINPVTKIMKPA